MKPLFINIAVGVLIVAAAYFAIALISLGAVVWMVR